MRANAEQFNSDPNTHGGFDRLACVLEARHGIHATEVAEFFSSVHEQLGDDTRCVAWESVADTLRQREAMRLYGEAE